ncbi:integrase/recombinase XerD [Hoeflea marina]|uniref:Integrase/recombinase XerD n=1 Tax=Hoeflea marina TaxID=274592 RepID=A0A317PIL8_9HYPH|nr:tyrosine-type recombinase/integrase [Hoeflea marina]PWV99278.1 integrase/recombinase XerD [Hoeflea marina]
MISLQDFQQFESYCRDQLGLGEHSLRAYRQDLTAFHRFRAASGDAGPVAAATLLAFHQHLRDEKRASPATIRRRFITLRSFFKWHGEETATASPFTGLRLDLKIPRRLPRPVDRPTLAQLLGSTRHIVELDAGCPPARADGGYSSDQVNGLMLRLLVVTGLRIGELTGLTLAQVSGAATRIRVRGKGNRERTVYVANERLVIDFRTYWDWRRSASPPGAPLFLNAQGNRLTAPAFRKRLRLMSESLSIAPYLTPHRFRHSAATLLIEEGVDIRIVQRLLGHASISTTELYTRVSDNSLVQAIQRADTLGLVDGK